MTPAPLTINQIDKKQPFDPVSIRVKTIRILRNVTAENGKHIQHVLVADATGLCKCTLWEDFMGLLQPNKSYQLCDFYVQEFRNKKYISNRIQGSRIEEIPDVDIGSIDPDSYIDDEEAESQSP